MGIKVRYEDMDKDIHRQKVAFQMVGIKIDYTTTDLLMKCIEATNKLGGEFSLDEASTIRFEHNLKWEKYDKKNNNEH